MLEADASGHRRTVLGISTLSLDGRGEPANICVGQHPNEVHARGRACDIAKTDAYVVSQREPKKVEMSLAHSSASCALTGCGSAIRAVPTTSSTSPPPRTSAGLPSLFQP